MVVTVVRAASARWLPCGGDGVNVGRICGNATGAGIFIENGGLSGGKGGDVEGNGYFCNRINRLCYGYLEQEEAFRRHGEDTEQGHETGVDCASLPLFARLPLPQECKRAAGHAGHRVMQVWHRDFHTRLFLARARGGWSYSPFQQ